MYYCILYNIKAARIRGFIDKNKIFENWSSWNFIYVIVLVLVLFYRLQNWSTKNSKYPWSAKAY